MDYMVQLTETFVIIVLALANYFLIPLLIFCAALSVVGALKGKSNRGQRQSQPVKNEKVVVIVIREGREERYEF